MKDKFSIKLRFLIILPMFLTGLVLSQEVTVFGQVTSYSTGMLQPVAGAHLYIDPDNSMSDFSDEDGYYEITFLWLWDGPVQLTCDAEGYITHYETFMPAGSEHELNILLEPVVNQEFSVLSGAVYNIECPNEDQMCPVADVMVSAWQINSPMDVAFTTYTDEWGLYELELPLLPEYGYDWMVSAYHDYFELLNEAITVGPDVLIERDVSNPKINSKNRKPILATD